jgi:hypothetical protein
MSSGQIRIGIKLHDLFGNPSDSYLLFEGRLVNKAGGSAYTNVDAVTLTNNGMMHLFSQISYQLGNNEIGTVFYPGRATTMFGILKYTDDFSKAQGIDQLWCKDTSATAVITENTGFATRQAYITQKPTTKFSSVLVCH